MNLFSASATRRFTRDVGTTFAAQAVGLLFSVASAAILARWLGPQGKGVLALAVLVPGMLGLFLSGGIEIANVYYTSSQRLPLPTLTANAISFAIIGTLLAAGIGEVLLTTGWLVRLVPGVPAWLFAVALLELPVTLLRNYFRAIIQGRQRIAVVNAVDLAQNALRLALLGVLVIAFDLGLLGAVVASIVAGTISLFILSVSLVREGAIFVPAFDLDVMRSTLGFGLRGHVGNVIHFFNYRLDYFVVNSFVGPAAVGIYTVAVRLAELVWYLPQAVGFVILPRAAASKPEEMNRFTPRVFAITLGLTAMASLALAIVGRPLIRLVYSSAFVSAYGPFLILLPGVTLLGGAKVLANDVAGRGYPHYNSITAGIALILTIVLLLVFVPRYGIVGAALVSSMTYAIRLGFVTVVYLVVSRRSQSPARPY